MKSLVFLTVLINFISSTIIINGPPELIKYYSDKTGKSNITATYSHFGRIPYGFQISGKLYYDIINQEMDMACKPLLNLSYYLNLEKNPILMVDRGNCTFVRKVKNVENTGAKAAIIVNNIPGDVSHLFMGNDGSGDDILIPAVMISKEDGMILQQFMKDISNNTNLLTTIELSINFEMLAWRKARIDLFYTSSDFKVYDLLKEFTKYQNLLENKDIIIPHLISFSDFQYSPNETKNRENCLGFGKYCSEPIKEKGITSENIIMENIRQMCVFNVGRTTNQELYLKYMLKFHDWCRDLDFTQKCSDNILSLEMKNDMDEIQKCVKNSFSDQNKTNLFLDDSLKTLKNYEVYFLPSIFVNNRTYMSSWTPENLLEAVCSGVLAKPEICFKSGFYNEVGRGGMSFLLILILIILMLVIYLIVYLCCRRYISRYISNRVSSNQTEEKINTIISSYIAFKDQEVK